MNRIVIFITGIGLCIISYGCTLNYVQIPSGNSNNVNITIDKYQDKDISLTPITSVSSGAASASGSGGSIK